MNRRSPSPGLWLFVGFLGIYWTFMGGHLYTGDARTLAATARSLLAGDGFAIPFEPGHGGTHAEDGKFYGQYGLGAVVTALPCIALGDMLPGETPPDPTRDRLASDFPFTMLNAPFAAGSVAMLHGCLITLGFSGLTAILTALTCGLGTMLWPYAGRDFTEPQATFLLLLAFHQILLMARDGKGLRAVLAGAAIGYGILTKVYIVVLAPLFLFQTWISAGDSKRNVAAFCAPAGVACLIVAWYNHHRFGSPFITGYATDVQNTHIPLPHGLYGLLFSSGKSFFLYNPPLLLAPFAAARFHQRDRAGSRFVWLLTAIHLLFFGIQQNWDGDWAWGPRYLLPLAVFLLIPAAEVIERMLGGSARRTGLQAAVAACLVLGVSIQILGVAVSPNDYVRFLAEQKSRLGDYLPEYGNKVYVPYHHHHWNPDLSPIRGHAYLLGATLGWIDRERDRMVVYSTAEEFTDRESHRLLPFVELGPAGVHAGTLDFWFASMPSLLGSQARKWILAPFGLICVVLTSLGILRLARCLRIARRHHKDSAGGGGGTP